MTNNNSRPSVRKLSIAFGIIGVILVAGVLGATLYEQERTQEVAGTDDRIRVQRLDLESTLDSLSSVRVTPQRRRLVPELGARYETQHGVAAFYWVEGEPERIIDGYLEELDKTGWVVEDGPTLILPEAKDDGTQIGSLAATAVKGQVRLFVYASENFKDPERGGTRFQVRVEPENKVLADDY